MFDNDLFQFTDSAIVNSKRRRIDTRRGWDSVVTDRGLYGGDGGSGGGGGSCSASNTTGCNPGPSFSGGGDGGLTGDSYQLPQNFYITGNSGIYSGSLSSQGNMLAMQINPGDFIYVETNTGNTIANIKAYTGTSTANIKPYLRGCMKEYWRDPAKCTFGSQSAMPAITGVMPAEFSNTPGNFNYYVDLQIARLFGGNGFDQFYFYNVFNQTQGWVATSNDYLAGLKNAENNNLNYYGFKNYDDLVTQGFNKYNNSAALFNAFNNIGYLVDSISAGNFGTSNAIAKTMVDRGLGSIGNLSGKLFDAGIIYSQMSNPAYTSTITNILKTITDATDLAVIQKVLKTNVVDISTPLDYSDIAKASGRVNDSGFKNMEEVGLDLYLRAPGANFTIGSEVAQLITNIQNESATTVENIATTNSLLTPDIIASLRSFLPIADGNRPVTIVDVIGAASGYLYPYMKEVNDGFAELLATKAGDTGDGKGFGEQLRTIMENMSRYAAGIPEDAAEVKAASNYTPVPPPDYTYTEDGQRVAVPDTGGPGYWAVRFYAEADKFFALLNTIVADPTTKEIATRINSNYYTACKLLNHEVTNYNKANFTTSAFSDNSQVFAFVSGLLEAAADRQNVATDYLLYGISQDNNAGNLLRSILAQGKNNVFLSIAGAKITGIV